MHKNVLQTKIDENSPHLVLSLLRANSGGCLYNRVHKHKHLQYVLANESNVSYIQRIWDSV